MTEVFSKTPWNIIFAQVFGAFLLVGSLALLLKKFLFKENSMKAKNVFSVISSVSFCLFLTTFTGMGSERFYAYPTAGLLVFLALNLKK